MIDANKIFFKLLLLVLSILGTTSCAITSPKVFVVESSAMEKPLKLKIGTSYDQVIAQLKERNIRYSDARDNPFFIDSEEESKVITALVNSYDDSGNINGTVSYRISFDSSNALFDLQESVALQKESLDPE